MRGGLHDDTRHAAASATCSTAQKQHAAWADCKQVAADMPRDQQQQAAAAYSSRRQQEAAPTTSARATGMRRHNIYTVNQPASSDPAPPSLPMHLGVLTPASACPASPTPQTPHAYPCPFPHPLCKRPTHGCALCHVLSVLLAGRPQRGQRAPFE
jgi:hypothetical protein